jgi:anti-sigma-K factor RskA
MEANEYIESGQLELFVYGVLPENEMIEVAEAIEKNPILKEEVEQIEKTALHLARAVSPGSKPENFVNIYQGLKEQKQVVSISGKQNWSAITAWAAVAVLVFGIFWMFQQQTSLSEDLEQAQIEKQEIENRLLDAKDDLDGQAQILAFIRNNTIDVIDLPPNEAVTNSAYAKVFYAADSQKAYLDLQGLPDPPEGMVYQAWSLLMNPLTPSSIGVIDDFASSESKLFELNNIPTSEAFGITLEPAGGSETPTLSNLYVLGTV